MANHSLSLDVGGNSVARQRRKRRPISCLLCRARKLKCDHAMPACGNCVNRGDITACRYVPRKNEARTPPHESAGLTDQTQAKIDGLERLLLSFMESHELTRNQSDTAVENAIQSSKTGSVGRQATANVQPARPAFSIAAEHRQSLSVDQAHWSLLINEIGDVRNLLKEKLRPHEGHCDGHSHVSPRRSEDTGPSLLFGSTKNISRAELLSHLPSRYSCDIFVDRFFAHLYPAIQILHEAVFRKQYDNFWKDRSSTSMAWVAMIFAILRVASLDYLREDDEPPEHKGKCLDLAVTFRNHMTDSLILADYTQPQEHLIEALILHLYAEYVASRDAKSTVWVLVGMVARLAMRMGYHQPEQPTLRASPFHAEMRRRAWTFIQQCDILVSFQMGLPSMIGPRGLVPSLPRNIHDESFGEDCAALPPALPNSVPTRISYLIAKASLAFGFAQALDEVSRTPTPRWERILEIDRDLRQIYDAVPEYYKLGQLSRQDTLVLVSARFVLLSIHHKSLCVVHSRFLDAARSDDKFIYSRRVCLTSAMSILRFQAIQDQKVPVNGQMRSLTNYQTSLAIHDYLLAATIITADLYSGRSTGGTRHEKASDGIPTRAEMIKALRTAADIFRRSQQDSTEAQKAADVLQMIVKRLEGGVRSNEKISKAQQRGSTASGPTPSSSSSRSAGSSQMQPSEAEAESSANRIHENVPRSFNGRPRNLIPTPPSSLHSQRYVERSMEYTGPLDAPSFDSFAAWSDALNGTYSTQMPQSIPQCPELELPESCNDQRESARLPEARFDNLPSLDGSSEHWPHFSAAFSFSDPMGSLWNMYSAPEEDFYME